MESIEVEAATIQLEALGFIKFSKDAEKMYITDKGIELAKDILSKLPVDERILLVMLGGDFTKDCGEYMDPED